MKPFSLPERVAISIAQAVEAQGGDMTDVEDLIEVWERLHADGGGRVDRMRYENYRRRLEDLEAQSDD